ncbi:hypothetical protein HanPI659440_Chr05g0218751 [Helianthus annuus]|nr:hypothetical protein HanPI659440_Chr05g0218751 [Helianthus annuus]
MKYKSTKKSMALLFIKLELNLVVKCLGNLDVAGYLRVKFGSSTGKVGYRVYLTGLVGYTCDGSWSQFSKPNNE